MSSFIAAGSSRSSHGVSMIPFFIYYSMFGFQRIGDLIWAAGDMRCRGFVMGGTAGRTTLAGEGLQHQDGNSHLFALAYPDRPGLRPLLRLRAVGDRPGRHPADVLRGPGRLLLHHADERELRDADPAAGLDRGHLPRHLPALASATWGRRSPQVRLLGSGAILREALRAQEMLESQFGVASSVYSVTSYKALLPGRPRRASAGTACTPASSRGGRTSSRCWTAAAGPVVAASDYVSAGGAVDRPWVGPAYTVLGTDGFGRSEARQELRRFFEVDAENIALAALAELASKGQFPKAKLAEAIQTLGLDPEKPNPVTV